MRRAKTPIEKDFIRYVMDNCGCPDGGTATSYETALHVLNMALERARPEYVKTTNVWDIAESDEIDELYKGILLEQRLYIKNKTGLFASLEDEDVGKSYYEKRWCSAALRFLSSYRQSLKAEDRFQQKLAEVLASEKDPVTASAKASRTILRGKKLFVPKGINPGSKRGREILRQVRVRCNQNVFRNAILTNYRHRCCICGIEEDHVLEAAHIQEWSDDLSNALNATNGLCLSATYHKAYDAHLLEIDSDYKIVLSKSLKETCTKEAHRKFFAAFDGKLIEQPMEYPPDKNALELHCAAFVE